MTLALPDLDIAAGCCCSTHMSWKAPSENEVGKCIGTFLYQCFYSSA